MSYIDETLVNDEEVLYRTKPHWIIFTPPLGWLFLAILILFLAPRYPIANTTVYNNYTLTDFLGIAVLLVALFSGLVAYITYLSSEYGITNRRILMKVGFISRTSLEILLQRVESIQVYQSVLGRIFDYGSIIVSGTGGSKDPFPNIPDPLVFRRYAQQQLEQINRP
ncbi:MAG: PH domain-containing protein [Gammaproteobacteria bacterium]|nr:PH domain-containing protein [Gammaproteobacteria bacterium]